MSSAFFSMDKCWKVPYAWLQACMGQGGQDYLEKAFLKILPSESVNASPSEAVQAIRQLAASKLYSFSSRGGQGAVDAGQEMINALVHGFSPSLVKNPSKFITMVWARLPYFCRLKKDDQAELVWVKAREATLKDPFLDVEH